VRTQILGNVQLLNVSLDPPAHQSEEAMRTPAAIATPKRLRGRHATAIGDAQRGGHTAVAVGDAGQGEQVMGLAWPRG